MPLVYQTKRDYIEEYPQRYGEMLATSPFFYLLVVDMKSLTSSDKTDIIIHQSRISEENPITAGLETPHICESAELTWGVGSYHEKQDQLPFIERRPQPTPKKKARPINHKIKTQKHKTQTSPMKPLHQRPCPFVSSKFSMTANSPNFSASSAPPSPTPEPPFSPSSARTTPAPPTKARTN